MQIYFVRFIFFSIFDFIFNHKLRMTILRLVIFSFLISTSLFAQKIEKGRLSGATKNTIDTLASQNVLNLLKESKGLLEREVDPNTYLVGPGDEFSISIISNEIFEDRTKITPEGKIIIKGAGTVDVRNKTLSEVREIVKTQIQKYIRTDNIDVALTELRQFKVIVSGTVPKPVSVPATAADRVSEIIDKASGLQFESSERLIKLHRYDTDEIINVDLMKFFMYGDQASNPTVLGGDLIRVPPINKSDMIEIHGEVASPGQFEFVEGDSLSTLIKFGQGFNNSSLLDSIEFVRIRENESLTKKIINLTSWSDDLFSSSQLDGDFPLLPGDRVYVRKKHGWKERDYVVVGGEVKYPGKYAINKDVDRVRDVVLRAGGFTRDASVENAEFIRQRDLEIIDPELERLKRVLPSEMSKTEMRYFQAKINEKKGVISINFAAVLDDENSPENVLVVSRDSIVVPEKNEFINVQGRVNNPGKVKFNPEYSYIDYIMLAGGYAYRADIDETLVNKPKGGQFLADEIKLYKIEPGDVILVPTEIETTFMDVFTTTLTIVTQLVTIAGVVIAITNINK